EYLGRADQQVKVRGFRIEPGEIEAVLRAHAAVAEARVVVREDAPGERRLVAYVVPAGEAPAAGELRAHVGERLPEHMVPGAFVLLEALPLTVNGKLDLRALPAPEAGRSAVEEAYAAPETGAEEILARAWAEVLRVARVGIPDNFFELGGDSILAIQVSSRARQAGLSASPRQLFEHPTVAALARVAGTAGREAEQGAVTGEAPLTPIQHWFFGLALPEPHHFNQAVLLEASGRLDPSRVRDALGHLVEHHDALRLRFTRQGGAWRQHYAPVDAGVALEHVDLTAFPPEARAAGARAVAAARQAGLDLSEGPLLRAVLFDEGAEGPQRLLLAVHHLAVDGVSWRILLEDLETACGQLLRGESVRLPGKTTSFRRWGERLLGYARSGPLREELSFWAERSSGAGRIPRDFPEGENVLAAARTVETFLDEEETRALLTELPGAYRTQVNDVLLCALAQAFREWTGERSLRIHLEGHGREELFADVDLSRTVGWFTSLFTVRLELEEGGPGAALKGVKEQLRAVPQRGIGYGVLRHLSDDPGVREALARAPEPEVSFNYLGQLDSGPADSTLFRRVQGATGPTVAASAPRAHLLDVNALVAGGRLRVSWTYGGGVHRRATVERLAERYLEALRALVAHCRSSGAGGYTPSDFPQAALSQDDLDDLLAELI
ncbi:MAG TPA: condensation domain-containing protein, partial [Longimicrobiaceae bacterium]|nr:condensation domain-containing protein [Longimicrobiaceae bacterium]